jgi:anti-sigma factor ChrR (cupin superfamily)
MDKHSNFLQRALVHSEQLQWQESPMRGVSRRPLERVGGEIARATTIVRYAPGSHFSPHVHTGGEEFFVLSGVFQDEHGDYPAGCYIRNPPQSRHTPGSAPGCVLFVKLWQFDLADRTHARIDTNKMAAIAQAGRPGVSVTPLFQDARETVSLERWAANTGVAFSADGGAELLVIDGDLTEGEDHLTRHAWLRVPVGGRMKATAGSRGATVWIKTGHLRTAEQEAAIIRARQ